MTTAPRFGREATIYLIGFAGVSLVQFVALPIYSRILGPAGYGLYSLTVAATTALAGVMIVGGDVTLARFWADSSDDRDRRRLASTWIAFLTLWSVIIAAVAAAIVPSLEWPEDASGNDYAGLLILGIAALVPTQLSRMLAQVLRNTFRPGTYSALLIVNALLDAGFGLAFVIWTDLGVHGVFLGILLGETLGSLIRLPFVRGFIGWDFDRSLLPPLLRFGVPFIPASLAMWALKSIDRIALSSSATPAELGHYGFAVSLAGPLTVVTLSLGQAWIPRVAQLDVADRAAASRMTSVAIEWSLAGFGTVAMLAGALAPIVVVLIGGSAFAESADVLPLLALGAAFAGVSLFAQTGLTLMKATKVIPVVTVAAAALDVGLLLLLIPPFGLIGAAAASAVAWLVLALLGLVWSNRVYVLRIRPVNLSIMLVVLWGQVVISTTRPSEVVVWSTTLAGIAVLVLLAALAQRSGRAGSARSARG